MPAELVFTGERFIPGAPGAIAYEHGHRYAFALRFARGRRVLDAACGEGYGSALLAGVAQHVIGVDISDEAIRHAREEYLTSANLAFEVASVTALPVADASVDLVVSFETIEHIPADDQPRMLAEFARVLAPGGTLLVSSPNKYRYSDLRNHRNPFHLHELYRAELSALLDAAFPSRHWYHQLPVVASAIFSEASEGEAEAWVGEGRTVSPRTRVDGLYYIVAAAKEAGAPEVDGPYVSLFEDAHQSELRRAEAAQAEVLRLDALLLERDDALAQRAAHVTHLEGLVAFRERLIEERDAALVTRAAHVEHLEKLVAERGAAIVERDADVAALRAAGTVPAPAGNSTRATGEPEAIEVVMPANTDSIAALDRQVAEAQAENARLEAALAAQERLIDYRESLRWWVCLPWVRARTWWHRRISG